MLATLRKPGESYRLRGLSRRGVRVVEGARLESVYTATYRGFESLPLRHKLKWPLTEAFLIYSQEELEPEKRVEENGRKPFSTVERSDAGP